MEKISSCQIKTLKLNNVLIQRISLENEEVDLGIIVEQMHSKMKAKGVCQIGPIIQHVRAVKSEDKEFNMGFFIMMQCNNYIHSVEPPYSMESIIRVPNCMYCRYIGPEDKLKFAYDKINLEAFENDIELESCSYTVFVDRNDEEETIVADVFIPRKDK